MDNKRQLERACKKRQPEAAGSFDNGVLNHLELSPKLWKELPTGLAYKVLSYFPVDMLVDTLDHVNWNLLTSPGFSKIFAHSDNLLSSYGFVTVPNREVPRLTTFEHESMQWREFPKTLPAEVMQAWLIHGGNDGLLMIQSKKCRIANLTFKQMDVAGMSLCLYSPDIGVWNPLLHSFKWLPAHPQQRLSFTSVVMVDEPSKTYKVFLQYTDFSSTDKFYLEHYSVYNSTTGTWTCNKLVPSKRIQSCVRYVHPASCSRYIVFVDAHEIKETSLWRYDVHRDSWDKFLVSKMLTDLDCSSRRDNLAWIDNVAILRGILYILIRDTSEGIVIASMDLSAETVTFKLETIVQVPSLPLDGFRFFNLYTYTLKGKGFVCVKTF